MAWFHSLSSWLGEHGTLLWCVSVASVVALVATPLVVAWLVTRLPRDYFERPQPHALASWDEYPALRLVLLIAKTAVGCLLIIAGIVMLIAPGQGVLTILVGLVLAEFPGKRRLERWLVTRQQVWRSVNWLRRRVGRPELERPEEGGSIFDVGA